MTACLKDRKVNTSRRLFLEANCGVIQNYGPDGGQATESKNLTEVGYKPAVVFGGELWCDSKIMGPPMGARQPKAKI
jgi:hypothetical protein